MGDPGSDRTLTADGAGLAASGGATFGVGAHVGEAGFAVRLFHAARIPSASAHSENGTKPGLVRHHLGVGLGRAVERKDLVA